MPVGLESLVDGGSITQTSNKDTKDDFYQLRPVLREE
jgi:hypothetical protein